MIILIILLVLTGIGIWLAHNDYDGVYMFGVIMVMVFGVYLIIHTLLWSLAGYYYNKMLVQRQAFIATLDDARKNKRDLELAAIVKDISEWNQNLAESKYENSLFLLQDYIDDRVMKLEPIK